MKRLFLTGPMGCGKSTTIAKALGDQLPHAGGFLTVRRRDEQGRAISFALQRPDGSDWQVFLDFSEGDCRLYSEVFEQLGVQLLEEAEKAPFAVLDEIGGIELLCPQFREALETLLQSGIPCIGVMKGTGPGSQMIRKLGLDEDYELAAEALRTRLRRDRETLLYECSQFDPEALRLARIWVSEFVRQDSVAILRP